MVNIKVGQGFSYKTKRHTLAYGLIIDVSNTDIRWIPVVSSFVNGREIVSYDDARAVYPKDKDNVRLASCPPPFSAIGSYFNFKHEPVSRSIALANMTNVKVTSIDVFNRNFCIVDDGAVISEVDMEKVFNHPWQSRNQRERILSDIYELNLDDDAHISYDVDF